MAILEALEAESTKLEVDAIANAANTDFVSAVPGADAVSEFERAIRG